MEETTFEKAFDRLEKILHLMNEGKISLDESIKLFEEADSLIVNCTTKLDTAEQKIETLVKKRNNEIDLVEDKPKLENFEV